MRSLFAMALMTGFVTALALASPACGSSSGGPGGSAGTNGSGGGKGTGGAEGGGGTKGGGGTNGTGGPSDASADGSTCMSLADAGDLFYPACITCLEASCSSLFDACLCDPQCVGVLKCNDDCVNAGASGATCFSGCSSEAGLAGSQASMLLGCGFGTASGCASACTKQKEAGCKGDAGELLFPACITCLDTSCPTVFETCLCDPRCVGVLQCTDDCVKKGGTGAACTSACTGDAGLAGSQASALYGCAYGKTSMCITACSKPADAGGAG
jgi:hypothetical protein